MILHGVNVIIRLDSGPGRETRRVLVYTRLKSTNKQVDCGPDFSFLDRKSQGQIFKRREQERAGSLLYSRDGFDLLERKNAKVEP